MFEILTPIRTAMPILIVCIIGVACQTGHVSPSRFPHEKEDDYCYSTRPDRPVVYMNAFRTGYDRCRGDINNYTLPPTCKPVRIWTLHAHANHYPDAKHFEVFKKFLETYDPQKKQLFLDNFVRSCVEDHESWMSFIPNPEYANHTTYDLTDQGRQELQTLAERLRNFLMPYIPLNYEDVPPKYVLRVNKNATEHAQHFMDHLLDTRQYPIKYSITRDKEMAKLTPWDHCDRYRHEVERQSERRLDQYLKSKEYLLVYKRTTRRIGQVNKTRSGKQQDGLLFRLTDEQVFTVYEFCSLHRSIHTTKYAWCAMFHDADLLQLEYRYDVEHYYKYGYGMWMAPLLARPLLIDLRKRFENGIIDKGPPVAIFFASSMVIEGVYTALGLFHEPPLLRPEERDFKRRWRLSRIACFNHNMMVMLLRCTDEKNRTTHRVQFFVNEKPTTLCPLEGCSWEQFWGMVGDMENDLWFCDPKTIIPDFFFPEEEPPQSLLIPLLMLMGAVFVFGLLLTSIRDN